MRCCNNNFPLVVVVVVVGILLHSILLCCFAPVESLASPIESSSSRSATSGIVFQPSRVLVDRVSQSYPDTLFRTLFSSVPRREFALRNVTLHVDSELVLLLGASSSGKSTLLRLVSGMESPTSGAMQVVHCSCDGQELSVASAQPIVIDRKPAYDDSRTVQVQLERIMHDCCDEQVGPALVDGVCTAVGLTKEDLDKRQSQLSPSENYRYGLACASLQSILPAVQERNLSEVLSTGVPSPVLLLDEWMDFETSQVVHRVEEAMIQMTKKYGAVIFCATHKPNLFTKSHRSVTLCFGKILSERMT